MHMTYYLAMIIRLLVYAFTRLYYTAEVGIGQHQDHVRFR